MSTVSDVPRVALNRRELRELAELVKRRLQRITGQEQPPFVLIVQAAMFGQCISNMTPAAQIASLTELIERQRARIANENEAPPTDHSIN